MASHDQRYRAGETKGRAEVWKYFLFFAFIFMRNYRLLLLWPMPLIGLMLY